MAQTPWNYLVFLELPSIHQLYHTPYFRTMLLYKKITYKNWMIFWQMLGFIFQHHGSHMGFRLPPVPGWPGLLVKVHSTKPSKGSEDSPLKSRLQLSRF
jgi:hypothetical protein